MFVFIIFDLVSLPNDSSKIDNCRYDEPRRMLTFNILSALLITLAYFMLLIQLRIFDTFAVFINLIMKVIWETKTFAAIFLIIIAAFANATFILSMIDQPDTYKDKVTGPNIGTAFLFIYRSTLGEMFID